jgi:LacI family transcriptional regulator
MSTLKDVANRVGVSVATVSYVLTGRGSVSLDTRAKVLAAVEALDYRPNRSAQAMRTGYSQSIGLLLPDLTNPFFPELAQKIENAARQRKFSVLLVDCQGKKETEAEAFELLKQQGVDGVIWCPASDDVPASLKSLKCPTVIIDRPIAGFDAVHSDYTEGGKILAEYALSLGHKKVGLLSGPSEIEGARRRREGFINTAAAQPDKIEIVWDVEVPFSTDLNQNAISQLKQNTASLIVAADDLIAVGAISALNELGLKVPEDVSVTGFDNIPWTTVVTPKLTTVNQPIAEMGLQAVELLIGKISNPEQDIRTVVLDVNLVERASVKSMIS